MISDKHVVELNAPAADVQKHLREHIADDSPESVKENRWRGVFMGKVASKKFYVFYKPPYETGNATLTVLRGDVGPDEEGDENRARLRYGFEHSHFRENVFMVAGTVFLLTLLMGLLLGGWPAALRIVLGVLSGIFWILALIRKISSGREKLMLERFISELEHDIRTDEDEEWKSVR